MRLPRGAKLLLACFGVLLAAMIVSLGLPDVSSSQERADDVVVKGDSLPVDEDAIFAWVEAELDADVPPPTIVVTSNLSSGYVRPFGGDSAPFYRLLLVENETLVSASRTPTAYYLADSHTIYLHPSHVPDEVNDSTRRDLAVLLVEEYVHAVQFRTSSFTWYRPGFDATTDERRAWQALKEGADVYVASRYADEHFPTRRNLSARVAALYRNDTATERYFVAPYYFGDRYLRAQVRAPSELWSVYATPPKTTEQLLHPEADVDDRLTNLSVRLNVNHLDTDLEGDRLGELSTRLILSRCLARERAIRAADGWGNDRLFRLYADGEPNYAWVLQWDDPAEATEFEEAYRRYLDCRASSDDGVWRDGDTTFTVQRVTNRTVVTFVGNSSFVANVSATARNDAVVVRLTDRPTAEGDNATTERGKNDTTDNASNVGSPITESASRE